MKALTSPTRCVFRNFALTHPMFRHGQKLHLKPGFFASRCARDMKNKNLFKISSFTGVICQFFGGGRLNMTVWNTLIGTLRWIWHQFLAAGLRMVPVGSPWTGKQTRQLTRVVNRMVPWHQDFFHESCKEPNKVENAWSQWRHCSVQMWCVVLFSVMDFWFVLPNRQPSIFGKVNFIYFYCGHVQTVESLEKNVLPSCRGWLQVT